MGPATQVVSNSAAKGARIMYDEITTRPGPLPVGVDQEKVATPAAPVAEIRGVNLFAKQVVRSGLLLRDEVRNASRRVFLWSDVHDGPTSSPFTCRRASPA